MQAPILDLLHRHIDGKGKQAKLKSPNELQVCLKSRCILNLHCLQSFQAINVQKDAVLQRCQAQMFCNQTGLALTQSQVLYVQSA